MFALLALLTTLHLTVKDNGHSFTVRPQRAIVVTLASNPSTGYRWKYEPSKRGGKVVKLISARYVPPKSGSPPGAAGKEVWRLRAVGKGKIDLQFLDYPPGTYSRRGPNVEIAIIDFTIHVR